MAADRVIYVDDIRPTGNGREEVWEATRRVGSLCSCHGIQDASPKRRQASQEPGAWAGSVVWVKDGEVRLLVSDDKWAKTKSQVAELGALVDTTRTACPEAVWRRSGFLDMRGQDLPVPGALPQRAPPDH